MEKIQVKKVPPDGGYGWIITLAYALNNVVVLPLIAGFGLIFQEAFEETNLSAYQGTLVITLNHGIGMLLSFFGGPLLRRFGYRKVAVAGAILIFVGLVLTSFASSFWMFILSYSIINSMGVATVMAAFTLAINSFFKEKRARAIGVGMSLTGLGAIYMPLLMSVLLYTYGWRHAVLVLAAICLHSLLGATLLRPAKWYLKAPPPPAEELVPLNKDVVENNENSVSNSSKLNGVIISSAKLQEYVDEENRKKPKSISMRSLDSSASMIFRNAVSHPNLGEIDVERPIAVCKYKWWESQEFNLASSINIFHESAENINKKDKTEEIDAPVCLEKDKRKGLLKIVDFFDLTLLKDPVFVNILLGLSIAACVETNFSLLFPIILKDMLDFETSEIAQVMAVIGFSDTLFRLAAPFIGEWCHKPPRVMYILCLLMIVFTRTIVLFTTTFKSMLFVAIVIGVSKGVRTVYMNVVIPSYVPLERLPFASGIQMFVNGIIIITIGSLLGRLREAYGTYHVPIIVLNVITMITVFMWSFEFIYFRIKKKSPEFENNA